MPAAFDASSPDVDDGVHLHWALPDALTHGRELPDGRGLEFPTVPNRWLVARFDSNDGAFKGKLWVVKSDNQEPLIVGTTASELTKDSEEITIAAPGLKMPLGAQQKLDLISGAEDVRTVVTSAAAATGAITIKVVKIPSLANPVAVGATVQVPTTSAFLDNKNATYAEVRPSQSTNTVVKEKPIGTPFSIEAWEAHDDPRTDELFLSAVGPGNISFAAFAPFVGNVFSFTDRDLPEQLANKYKYTYAVVGWYSNPNADPLAASVDYNNLPQIWRDLWADRSAWEKQTPAERFQTLLRHMQWSASPVTTPPTSSLYHATLPGVLWAYDPTSDGPPVDSQNIQVAVGNSPIDALSALVAADMANPAGKQLAELLEAAQYDLLKDYGQPGGQALVEQQIHNAWYGSKPGGILWEVVGRAPDDSGQAAQPPRLTPAQTKALDAVVANLNTAQRASDQAQRELASLQSDLYIMWWKVGISNAGGFGDQIDPDPLYPRDNTPQWKDLKPNVNTDIYPELFQTVWKKYCAVQTARSKLPDPMDAASAQAWADKNWKFPGTSTKANVLVNLSALGLQLKSTPMPRYWQPNDPVVLIRGLNRSRKHGEDGCESDDDTMRCRLSGETITGLKIDGQPSIDVKTVTAGGVNLDPLGPVTKIPSIANLIHEAFFVDPANAATIAHAVSGDEPKIAAAIEAQNSWAGTPPVCFAITPWKQAWSPLFLEWSVSYFPTGKGQAEDRQFQLDDWLFDGQSYSYTGAVAVMKKDGVQVEEGSGFDPDYNLPFVGSVFVTPQSPMTLKKNIAKYLKNYPKIDSKQLEALLANVGEWDLLTQSLSGFNDGLLSLKSEATFPPPPTGDKVGCPPGQTRPSVSALVENQYHALPVLVADEDPRFGHGRNHFYPVRGGFIQFRTLRVIDAFGQCHSISLESGSEPIPAQGMVPFTAPEGLPLGAIQLPPRVVQPSRLDFRWLANDNTGTDVEVADHPNAICGWLLPNHLDGGISVYDSGGQPLGELYPPPYGWRPRPGDPGNNPPPAQIGEIKNVALRDVLASISSHTEPDVFNDFLASIDATLWMIDPLGGRKDQMQSVLIGRPLAVAQAQLQLDWYGNPTFNQLWQKMLKPKNYVKGQNARPPWQRVKDIGGISDVSFPVRLGNLQLLNDGLLGYYLPAPRSGPPYGVFYSVHKSAEIKTGETYIKQIRKPDPQAPTCWTYQGDLTLKFPQPQADDPVTYRSDPVTVTMLVDPRGVVHATTGILPTISIALPPHRIEDFLKKLAVTFRTGPIIADPGPLRTPQPAESHGSWTWIQRSSPTAWEEDTIVNADDRARLPDEQLQLREGWLKFTE
jgi:hypothetical protein